MLPVFPLILAAYLPGRIKAAMKHPMLAAVKFWAFAHLLSSGLLADVLLFGAFLVWAICDRISLKRRPPQAIRTAPEGRFSDLIAVSRASRSKNVLHHVGARAAVRRLTSRLSAPR